MRETWYVLEDGTSANPLEVAPDDKGVLRHKSGMAVGIRPDGNPMSRGVDLDELALQKLTKKKAAPKSNDRQIKAEDVDGAKYKTR